MKTKEFLSVVTCGLRKSMGIGPGMRPRPPTFLIGISFLTTTHKWKCEFRANSSRIYVGFLTVQVWDRKLFGRLCFSMVWKGPALQTGSTNAFVSINNHAIQANILYHRNNVKRWTMDKNCVSSKCFEEIETKIILNTDRSFWLVRLK